MSNKRKGRLYRIVVIIVAFVLIGAAVFIPLMAGSNRNDVVIYIALAVYAAALIGTILVNEIIIHKRKKIENEREEGTSEG